MPPLADWRRYTIWLLVVAILVVYWIGFDQAPQRKGISYTEFKQAVRQGKISEVILKGQQISGTFKTDEEQGREQQKTTRQFVTTMPSVEGAELLNLLEEHDVTVKAEKAEEAWWLRALIGILPWILLIGLVFYATHKMQERMAGAQGGMFNFGKSRAKRFHKSSSSTTFNDVAGLENSKRDLLEIIDYLKNPERYKALGAKIPRGVLLLGPPGTGKTLLARAVAGEAEASFFSTSGSEFIEMVVGVGAARVRDMFESAKKETPAIVFVDEHDAVGRSRGAGVGGGHDEREQTLNQILSEMDGFSSYEAVVVLAATNRPDILDAALMRPGRFDRKLVLELPRKEARRQILEIHAREVPLAEDVDLDTIATRTVGFSGADLENLVNEAALLAGRKKKQKVDAEMLEQARDKIVLGAKREGMLSEEEKRLVAYHESGHALMAHLLPNADPLERVSIIPRGRALGTTEQSPEEERHNLKQSYLIDRIGVMLGGRVSERIVFGEVSTGAENDLKQATGLARRMVCQWGMSEKIGPVTFSQGEEHVFLGRELSQQRDFSEHTAKLIDDEVRRLIGETEAKVEQMFHQHREKLDALAETSLEAETLEAAEIQGIFKDAESRQERASSVG
jgi:cell division protease FtsH